jgi:hypothetical protein
MSNLVVKKLKKTAKGAKEDSKIRSIVVGTHNFISQIFFYWVFHLIIALRRTKDLKNLILLLRDEDNAEYNDNVLGVQWEKEKQKAKENDRFPLIRRAIFKAYGLKFILNGIWKLLWGASLWFGAYWLLKQTIAYVRLKNTTRTDGHLYAMGFFLSSALASICIHQLLSKSGSLGLRVFETKIFFLNKTSLKLLTFDLKKLKAKSCSPSSNIQKVAGLVSRSCWKHSEYGVQ